MEMSWQDATLISRSWSHEEVVGLVFILISRSLDESFINDAAIWWIHEAAILVLDKEALCDPLVHNNKSDLRCLSLVVKLIDRLLELRDLLGKADITLSVTKTISINNKVGREIT